MPNSCDAAASVQYLLAFFTYSYPALNDSKIDPVRTIIAFDFRTARTVRRGRIQYVSGVFSLSRLTRLCAHQMVRQFKKKHPRKYARLFSSASADAAAAVSSGQDPRPQLAQMFANCVHLRTVDSMVFDRDVNLLHYGDSRVAAGDVTDATFEIGLLTAVWSASGLL